MSDDTLPHDLGAEEDLLAAMIANPAQIARAGRMLMRSDFYRPAHGELFELLGEVHGQGRTTNGGTVAAVRDEIRRRGITDIDPKLPMDLLLASAGSGDGLVDACVAVILRCSTARAVVASAGDVRSLALKATEDPAELIDRAAEIMAGVRRPPSGRVDGLSTMSDFLAAADRTEQPWVVAPILRAGWRAMIVGGEGVGKAVTMRQIAGCAAQGVHPFTWAPIPPIRALLVDTENPDDAIAETAEWIEHAVAKRSGEFYDPDRLHLWRQPGGLNIRDRSDRLRLEQVIAETRPALVCAGPMYKLYRLDRRESDEIAALEVQQILDDLRARYGFALVLEHHAPKAQGGAARDLVPYGSSVWLRWPELGIKLTPNPDGGPKGSLAVGRWRRDRVECLWPDRLDRATDFPWLGRFPEAPAQWVPRSHGRVRTSVMAS